MLLKSARNEGEAHSSASARRACANAITLTMAARATAMRAAAGGYILSALRHKALWLTKDTLRRRVQRQRAKAYARYERRRYVAVSAIPAHASRMAVTLQHAATARVRHAKPDRSTSAHRPTSNRRRVVAGTRVQPHIETCRQRARAARGNRMRRYIYRY